MSNKSIGWSRLLAAAAVSSLAVAVAAVGAVPAVAAPQGGYGQREFQRDLDAVRDLGVTGVIGEVRTARGGFRASSGVAEVGKPGKPAADGHFRIASVTKSFVATVALQLVGEGRLGLEDTVERWLPGVVQGNGNDGNKITVRQLMQHTSGVYDYLNDIWAGTPEQYYQTRFNHHPPADLVRMAVAHPPVFEPGAKHAYSNTNFILVGMIIQRVTGRTWDREVHDRIVVPLGLTETTMPGPSPRLPSPHAKGYQQFAEGGPLVDTTLASDNYADGGLVSTPGEVSKFFRAVVRKKADGGLLEAEQLKQMQTTVAWDPNDPGRAGLGLFQFPLPCGGVGWGHGGGALGFITMAGATASGDRSAVISLSSSIYSAAPGEAGNAALGRALCG